MLEQVKMKLKYELDLTKVRSLFVEDAYRLQTVIDDHLLRMEGLVEEAKAMVIELEKE